MKPLQEIITFLLLLIATITFSQNRQTDAGPPDTGGTVSGSDIVCSGNNSGALNLTGNDGPVMHWEYSTTGGSPWAVIYDTTESITYYNLTQTTYFRAVVSDAPDPPVYSSVATITVQGPAIAGEITGTEEVCLPTNSVNLQLNGYEGHHFQWQYKNTGSSIWLDFGLDSPSLNINNQPESRHYRCRVTHNECTAIATTPIFTVIASQPTVAGTIQGADTVCSGNNSGTLELTGKTGDVIRWESSSTGSHPWNSIHITSTTLDYTNLSSTVWFRVLVQNNNCDQEYTDAVAIEVDPETNKGIAYGDAEVCKGINSGQAKVLNYTGDIMGWQYSINGGMSWTDTTHTSNVFNYINLDTTTQYRAVIQSGICNSVCSDEITITVNPLPQVSFSSSGVCEGEPTVFQNNSNISQGGIANYSWDFGDSNGANLTNPQHTYANFGVYNVQLTATSAKGCTASASDNTEVYEKPVADFYTGNVCLGIETDFVNASSISAGTLFYSWDLGDGTGTSSAQDTSYNYQNAGAYNVFLKIVSDHACSDSITKTVEIYDRPQADFVAANVCDGQNVSFNNNSTIGNGNIIYAWYFGDGASSGDSDPQHLYDSYGSYFVKLVANTTHNCADSIVKTIYVHPVPEAVFSKQDVCIGDSVHFTNSSSIANGTYSSNWNFGDGTTSSAVNPVHLYQAKGSYNVSLKITSDSGCVVQAYDIVKIYSQPSANFIVGNVCDGFPAQFQNLSTIDEGTITAYWMFGDGDTTSNYNPEHLYDTMGVYNITLVASSGAGCSDTINQNVQVYPNPVAGFTVKNSCDGFPVQFTNTSNIASGIISSYSWDFGDGTNSAQLNPEKQYLNTGVYNVTLDIVSDHGCLDTYTGQAITDVGPIANFTAEDVCLGETMSFSNLSSIANGTLTYNWNFGDQNTSIHKNPQHNYAEPGVYNVKLITSSNNGCLDSLSRYVEVYNFPQVYAGEDTTISKGEMVALEASGAYQYTWYPTEGVSSPFSKKTEVSPAETTEYIVMGEDAHGCVNYDTVSVFIIEDFKIIANNIITPDGNGENDTWIIQNMESYPNSEVFIFDRWGNEVFYASAYHNDWNAVNKNGDILPDGTYYYMIDIEGSGRFFKGAITIIRNK